MSETREPFLSRWSRLKRAHGRREVPPAEAEASAEPGAAGGGEPAGIERADFDPANLPDPDTLGPDADFRVYLREGVPEEMKRRALRRLWRTNPIIRSVDMLDDYCEDFTDGATVVAGLRTVYEAGRGLWQKLEAAEAARGEARVTEVSGDDAAEAASSENHREDSEKSAT